MAARLEQELQVSAEIVEGRRGEFTVWVGPQKVAEKTLLGFPSDDSIVAAVRRVLGAAAAG